MKRNNIGQCHWCESQYDAAAIKRIYNKDSSVYNLGYCSSNCYTKASVAVNKIRKTFNK